MKKKSLLKRVAALSVIMAIVGMLLCGVVLHTLFRHNAVKHMEEKLNSSAGVCSYQIYDYDAYAWLVEYWEAHGDEMEDLPFGGDEDRLLAWFDKMQYLLESETRRTSVEEIEAMSPEEQKVFAEYCYWQLYIIYSSLRESLGIDIMGLFIPKEDGKTAYCILELSRQDAEKTVLDIERNLGKELPFDIALHPEAQKVMDIEHSQTLASEPEFYRSSTDGKEYASMYIPIGADMECKALLSLTESMELLNRQVWKDVLAFELWIALVIAVAVFLLLMLIYLTSLKPVVVLQKEICAYTEDKDRESLTKRLDALMKRGDEIGQVSCDVNTMACEIERHFQEIIRLTGEKEHLEGELAMAANLKAHLMPNVFPAFPEETAFDIMADQITAEGVGGDYYDFFRVDEDHIAFVMADIFAGGSVSALYMIVFKLLLNSISKFGFSVDETLKLINDRMCEANEDDLSLSVWYGLFEISTGKVDAVNAGHEAPILIHDNKAALLSDEVQSYLIGIFPDMAFNRFSFCLEPGDRLLLYTDGVYQSGKDLLTILGDEQKRNASETVGFLQDELLNHVDTKGLTEDMTLLCLERKTEGDRHE